MRTKICGITRLEDAEAAAAAGAWAIGLNFHPASARCVPDEAAELIGVECRRRLEVAGVFVDASLGRIARLAERCELTMVQLHGSEGPSFCKEVARSTGCKVVKAFQVRSQAELRGSAAWRTDMHLFDAYRPGSAGGTGECFDWELLAAHRSQTPTILAGGLTPESVAEAIGVADPWAVDVAGGVEDGTPGIKDRDLVERFIAEANQAHAELHPASEDGGEAERSAPEPEVLTSRSYVAERERPR